MTLVILDIGATIVTGPDRGPWSRLAAELDLDATQRAFLREAIMTSDLETPKQLAALVDDAMGVDSSEAVERLWHAQLGEARPLNGARQAIERLVAADIDLALVSNIWRPYLLSVERHFADLFDAHISDERRLFSFREGIAKPDPELFERLLERTQRRASDAVMIGDSYVEDIAPAASLGIATIWLAHRPERESEAIERLQRGDGLAPTLTLDSITQVEPAAIKRALAASAEGAITCA